MLNKATHTEQCPKCAANGKDSRGDNLVVYEDGGAYCFACKFYRPPKFYKPVIKENNVAKHLLPFDFTREVPANALLWLLQFGLPYSYWKESIGYSPKEQRLVFTVGNPIQFSIGRYIESSSQQSNQSISHQRRWGTSVLGIDRRVGMGETISNRGSSEKWKPKKWYVWGDCHKHYELVQPSDEKRTESPVVLVEDLISAHKVGQVTTAVPLFGTKIHPCHLYYLINENKPVVLWLDKDQELNVMKQAWQLESVINQKVKIVVTDKDPKWLTEKEIQNEIYI